MAGGITYADLRFARSPPEKSHGEEPNEGELTYENLQVPLGLEKEAAEGDTLKNTPELPCWATFCHRWRPVTTRPMLGALALCLFLLATNITLGVQYMQASRQLQQASRDHAAKSLFLGERTQHLQASLEKSRHRLRLTEQELNSTQKELNSTQKELNSTKKELNSTTEALWQSQAAKNQTWRQLQHQELLLGQANHSLALLQRERASLKINLSQASSCRKIGCCPDGWTLFRWKCLWASEYWESWSQSKVACEKKSSRLLVLPEPWSVQELWEAVGEAFTQSSSRSNSFWVGLQKDKKVWKWVDGSLYKGETLDNSYGGDHAVIHNGQLSQRSSAWYRYICEKAASPEDPSHNGWQWGP
ncbi:B-cell differentiation antigen CD72-like [Thamnophis elegans]|uniref:B-cell differentiation antigen CD72-like n=1 Tax=Thamnophis elegans TaxID=35005 RepID=UPI001378FFF5|nr:B-cell differentiation antigen CD72-like [Thamnophis elegans]